MKLQFGVEDASFKAAGEQTGVRLLVEAFYRIMDSEADFKMLRDMHKADLTESIDKLYTFLCGWLGGPRLYREKYGPISIPLVHRHLNVDQQGKEQWLSCMRQAIDEQNYSEEFSHYLITQLSVPAERIVVVNQAAKNVK